MKQSNRNNTSFSFGLGSLVNVVAGGLNEEKVDLEELELKRRYQEERQQYYEKQQQQQQQQSPVVSPALEFSKQSAQQRANTKHQHQPNNPKSQRSEELQRKLKHVMNDPHLWAQFKLRLSAAEHHNNNSTATMLVLQDFVKEHHIQEQQQQEQQNHDKPPARMGILDGLKSGLAGESSRGARSPSLDMSLSNLGESTRNFGRSMRRSASMGMESAGEAGMNMLRKAQFMASKSLSQYDLEESLNDGSSKNDAPLRRFMRNSEEDNLGSFHESDEDNYFTDDEIVHDEDAADDIHDERSCAISRAA